MKISIADNIAVQKDDLKYFTDLGLDVDFHEDIPDTQAELISRIGNAEIAVFDLNSKIDSQVILAAPKLKLLVAASTGFWNVDIESANKKNIIVCNCPNIFSEAVAEYVLCQIIDLYRKIRTVANLAKNGIWAWDLFEGQELSGKVLGVIGSGKIGEKVIKIGQGLGMEVMVNTLHPSSEKAQKLGITDFYPLDELLQKSDVVTLHIPGNEQTKNLLSANKLKLMKTTALLINTSPNDVIDLQVLYKMLMEGNLGGAGLDYEGVNPKKYKSSPIYTLGLMNLPNVNLTPNMAWYTKDGKLRLKEMVKQNVAGYITAKIINQVN